MNGESEYIVEPEKIESEKTLLLLKFDLFIRKLK